jgi:predicted N-acetyltransferase YhbS
VLIEIREERPDDHAAVREVNKLAFGQDQESNIVDALRANRRHFAFVTCDSE